LESLGGFTYHSTLFAANMVTREGIIVADEVMNASAPGPNRILGVDPGLNITGYAVIESGIQGPKICEAGVIRGADKRAKSSMAERLRCLYDGIVEILEEYRPAVMVVEQLYAHYDHPRTAILMAHARGAIMLAGAQRAMPVVSYNATQVKKIITGAGRATKEQMQRAMQRELNLAKLPEPPDVADALAVALCHYYRCKIVT